MNNDQISKLQFVYWGNHLDDIWEGSFEAEAGAGPMSEAPSSSSDLEVSNEDDTTAAAASLPHADESTCSSFGASNMSSGASAAPVDQEVEAGASSSVKSLVFVDETELTQQRIEAGSRGLHGNSSAPDDPEQRRSSGPQGFIHAEAGERPSLGARAMLPIPPGSAAQGRTPRLKRARIQHKTHSNDGYQWSKYGQKMINTKGPERLRKHYFRCTFDGCKAKKTTTSKMGAAADEASIPDTVQYTGEHNHSLDDLELQSGRLVRVKACSQEPGGPRQSRMDTFQLPASYREGSE